jgi:hypothetical protein
VRGLIRWLNGIVRGPLHISSQSRSSLFDPPVTPIAPGDLSVIVTGAPSQLRRPTPLPSETLAQLVVRNHPIEWRNFVERMRKEIGLSLAECERLYREVSIDVNDDRLREKILSFVNLRLPTYSRTFEDLVRLKKHLEEPFEVVMGSFRIVEVLWPREIDPSGDDSAERAAQSLGARVILFPTGASRVLDLLSLLPEIHGEYVWVLPGCTRITMLASLSLLRVKRAFDSRPQCAVYTDNADSFIYRVSALQAVLPLASSSKDLHLLLKEAGFTPMVDDDDEHVLCELEKEFGGKHTL